MARLPVTGEPNKLMESLNSIRRAVTSLTYIPFYEQLENWTRSKEKNAFYENKFLGDCRRMEESLSGSLWNMHLVNLETLGDVQPYTFENLQVLGEEFYGDHLVTWTMHGRLYRGFTCDGREVCIKLWDFLFPFHKSYADHPISFCNELEILMDQNPHPCLMKLNGFCFHKKLAIVYEQNPSKLLLHVLLKGKNFGWYERMKVATQLADLFSWLHEKKIIFGCVDSSTIAIQKDCSINVFDFGLLAHASGEDNSVDASYRLPVDAPEFAHGIRTLKSDVYTFGVLLLQLIADKKYIHISRLQKWICYEFQGKIKPIMNESLLQSDELADGFNKLVVKCLEEDPNARPSMVDVYRSLSDLGEGSNMKAEAENAILNLSEELQSARGKLSYVRSRRVGLEAQASELQKMLGPMQSVEEEVQALRREKSELEDMERAASVQKQGLGGFPLSTLALSLISTLYRCIPFGK